MHEDKATEQSRVFNIVAVNGLDLFDKAITETEEKLKADEYVKAIASMINSTVQKVAEILKEIVRKMIAVAEKLGYTVEEINTLYVEAIEREERRELYKLDFTRPKVRHQVLCRQPKRLVKKIIR